MNVYAFYYCLCYGVALKSICQFPNLEVRKNTLSTCGGYELSRYGLTQATCSYPPKYKVNIKVATSLSNYMCDYG